MHCHGTPGPDLPPRPATGTSVGTVTLYLVVGLPGAGKTTRARELEVAVGALRLTPDDWLRAVFADDDPEGWRAAERVAHRDRIEGKLVEVGLRAAERGLDVVLDFGLWGRDERSALRWIAAARGIHPEVVYLPVEPAEQRRRVAARYDAGPGEFLMTDAELAQWQEQFEVPDATELAGGAVPPVPPPHATWSDWASARWPSLPPQVG